MKIALNLDFTVEEPCKRFSDQALALKSLDPTSISDLCQITSLYLELDVKCSRLKNIIQNLELQINLDIYS